MLLNYTINEFYPKSKIWKDFHVANRGGIRPSIDQNLVVVFLDAPNPNPKPGQDHNIYHDRYDTTTGVYYYTGRGQEGDQTPTGPNKWLIDSNKNKTTIHLFRQYSLGSLHQYIGKVKVVKVAQETQQDHRKINRLVYVFSLLPEADAIVTEEDAFQREIDYQLTTTKKESKEQIKKNIANMDKLTTKRGSKTRTITVRTKTEHVRYRGIVLELRKLFDEKCQICKIPHFEKKSGKYAEVHHIIPWAKSHDDSSKNLIVICANCHRKMHYAKDVQRMKMYEELIHNYPNTSYCTPDFYKKY
ncbi:HNH endonuclease [Nitrosopumilus adriaticus]|uniref:HNH nuclease domain-containing protein n=1 Tax=Nitrosopumilus adriaticus TaxID=1580092 RepID=A0A0D5C3A8_9ARCH|nr:HNH endonuclease [Nitrosopumilus adriaticus]AJW71043.1 hypothetical protein NADRNF5_1357 [Nitrosopumilus adriaticus]